MMKSSLIFCAAALHLCATVAAMELRIVLPHDVLEDYQKHSNHLAAFATDSSATAISFSSPYARRDVVEVQLLLIALRRGGLSATPVFITADSYSRILRVLSENDALISGNTMWLSDVDKNPQLFASSALIRNGESEAGLFTTKTNLKVRGITSIKELQNLSAVSNRVWVEDWNALTSMRLRELQHQPTWDAMVRLVNSHRADFLLAPFPSTEDLSFKVGVVELLPIGPWKVQLFGSRHFAIAKNHQRSYMVLRALDDGLLQLHNDGSVAKALHESGFFNPKVKSWTVVNPKPPLSIPNNAPTTSELPLN